ncbi:MAG: hypothetical protein JSU65_06640 [Candidatus Zixiibacteriota bacterium]|nr:MAG: hypothetical protein JSU65_06640 [candidate division Zixibacteria bacterium]
MAELYLVEFKGARREFFYNTYYHSLSPFDYVIIQAEQGEDIGLLSKKIDTDVDFTGVSRPRSILRPAGSTDRERYEKLRRDEIELKKEVDRLVGRHGLDMKVIDVECQFDGSKITYYFVADHRVDFRALVRDLASRHKTRIELRQIGVRDEARRVGGFGICGREQCCTAHIRDFAPISTQHARDQDLSLNPSKISGNCGRLLCCLRYEAELYIAAKKNFPPVGSQAQTKQGKGVIDRIDVFNEEAIIIDESNMPIRVRADQIIDWEKATSRGRKTERKKSVGYDPEGEEEAGPALDDPEIQENSDKEE